MSATVLITPGSGGLGIGAITALKRQTEYQVITIDMDSNAGGLYLADKGFTSTPAYEDADAWLDNVTTIIRENDVDVVLLQIDSQLEYLPSLRERTPSDVTFVSARQRIIDITNDKYSMTREFEQYGLNVPNTWLGSEHAALDSDDFPVVVKPRRGQGNSLGDGVEIARTADEVETYLSEADADPAEFVVQEYVEGTEFTSGVIVTKDNELLAVVPKEAKSEDPYWRVTREAPAISRACTDVFEALEPAGMINVQHILPEEGNPYLIEINPRFSHSSTLSAASGVNPYHLLIKDALGEPVEAPDSYTPDLHMIEHVTPAFVPDDELFD